MTKPPRSHNANRYPHAIKSKYSQPFILTPLTYSIRELITLGGLTIVASSVWAEAQTVPTEIWLNPGTLQGICSKDIDQDGDLDIFTLYPEVVRKLENIGTPSSPEFTLPRDFISNQNNLALNNQGITDCLIYGPESSASVDIDADGDLDLFTGSSSKFGGLLDFARNIGSNEHPTYVHEDPQDILGLPADVSSFIFKDVDGDGDQDFWSDIEYISSTFYENTGTPENAVFVQQNESPIKPLCKNEFDSGDKFGFLIDLNNDGQWDMLCRTDGNRIDYIESSTTGYLPEKNLFTTDFSGFFESTQTLDIDNDGDIDVIGRTFQNIVLYTNISSGPTPEFNIGQLFPLSTDIQFTFFSDLNSDDNLDYIYKAYNSQVLNYAINIGNNVTPSYAISTEQPQLEQCNNSIHEIPANSENDPVLSPSFNIENVTLVDIDGDNDLDLFSSIYFFEASNSPIIVYCENQGSSTNPLFGAAIKNPFGLSSDQNSSFEKLSFGDIDGDDDQDAWLGTTFFDNIGTPEKPLFRQITRTPSFSGSKPSTVSDTNGDGQIDSILTGNEALRLLYDSLEPATIISAAPSTTYAESLILATARPSHVQLQICEILNSSCFSNIFIPITAKELSVSTGDFDGDGQEDIVLATIDSEDLLKIQLYNDQLKLIGSGAGGFAHSISVSAGQLDNDHADEYVVSLVQSDNGVAAIAFNLDGSRIGKAQVGSGKHPSIDTGNFSETGDTYVLAYLTLDDRLKTATFHGNGTLINQGDGGAASYVKVSKTNILSSNQDDYVTSLIQADNTAALIGFSSHGTQLGKVVGDQSQQPTVVSGAFPGPNSKGLAVSLIQPDKRPAIIFLDNHGRYIATGVGGITASMATSVMIPNVFDGADDGVLVYIDESGIVRWQVFAANGVQK